MQLETPLHEIPVDKIAAVRAELVAQADQLLERSEGTQLGEDAATEFRQLEAAVAALDFRARAARPAGGHLDLGRILGDVEDANRPRSAQIRTLGGVSPIAFTSDQLHELHDAYMSHRSHSIQVDPNIETRDVTAPPMSTIPGYRLPPSEFRREPTRIASLLPTQPVQNVSVTYYRQTTAASAAATVAEAAAKPESDPGWTAVTATVRKIAHFIDVSKEALDDYPNFASVVQDEGKRGLINAENLQLLSGDGTGTNLTGLLATSGILTYAPGSAEARYISLRHAMTLLRTGSAFTEPDAVVLHPADWELFDLSNATSAGIHATPDALGGVRQPPARSAWDMPITITGQITSGIALVGNLGDAAVLFEREPATVFVDPYSQSANNLVRFIFEERLALGVPRPTALLKLTFNGGA